jgi:hypothetical protein
MRVWLVVPAVLAAVLLGGAARAPVVAFGKIAPGEWQLRPLDGGAAARRMCVNDAYELVQLRHPGAACSRFVLANEPQAATVHYTCTGAGYGRTTIRVESGELIRVDSQGLANQMPFQMAFEGRRVGRCGPDQAAR